MGDKGGTARHPDLGGSIKFSSIWRMDDMKATLRIHAYIIRFIHRATAATRSSTTRIYFSSNNLGPDPKNGEQSLAIHSALDDVR